MYLRGRYYNNFARAFDCFVDFVSGDFKRFIMAQSRAKLFIHEVFEHKVGKSTGALVPRVSASGASEKIS